MVKKYLFLIIFFFSCLEKPKFPEWDTEITIPLLEKNFTIFSFLDSHYFVFNSDSTFNFFYQDNLDTLFPMTKINFNIDRFNVSYYLNDFEICDTFSTEIIINIEEILGISIPDSFILLPPINQGRNLEKLISLNNFRQGFIEESFLILTIENHSPINFEYFKINLNNFDFNFGKLGPHSQKEHSTVVNNIFISSPFNFLLTYRILTEDSLLVKKRDYLKLAIKFTNIKLREGELKFKNTVLNHTYNYYFGSSSDFDLNYGEIKEGYGELYFFNQFPFPLSIFLKIREINYEDSFDIFGYARKRISFSLEGQTIKQNFPEKKGIFMAIEISAQIKDTENFFNIRNEDYFSFSGQIKKIKFKKIEANFLSPICFLNKRDSLVIDFLGNPKGIKFEKAEMLLDFVYNVKTPMEFFLNGKSINRNQEICSLYKEIELPPFISGHPFNQVRKKIDITNLINNGLKILKFNYCGNIKGKGKLEDEDFVWLDISIEMPLKISFSKDTFIAYEKEISIDKETGKKISENLIGGELVVDVVNHFPIGFDGDIIIKSEEGKDSILLPFTLKSGIISQKGYCEKERESRIILEMDENQLEIFKKEKLKTLLKINLPESDTIILRPIDFLSFKAYAILKVKTKEISNLIKK